MPLVQPYTADDNKEECVDRKDAVMRSSGTSAQATRRAPLQLMCAAALCGGRISNGVDPAARGERAFVVVTRSTGGTAAADIA